MKKITCMVGFHNWIHSPNSIFISRNKERLRTSSSVLGTKLYYEYTNKICMDCETVRFDADDAEKDYHSFLGEEKARRGVR